MNINVNNVHFSYSKKGKEILKGVNCNFAEGKFTAIIGPNGCGKTTLLKCINKINEITNGTIQFDNKDVNTMSGHEIAKMVGYVPQFSSFNMSCSVMEFVLMGRRQHLGWSIKQEDIAAVADTLSMLGIEHLSKKLYTELSGGQKQKVLVARALMQESDVYLFDEPTSNLDLKNELEIMKLAKSIVKEHKKSVIMVVHDLNMVVHYADDVVIMKDGIVIEEGKTFDVVTTESLKNAFGVNVIIEESGFVNPFSKQILNL